MEILTQEDVSALPWAEIVTTEPAADVECYWLDDVRAAARFVAVNGLEFVRSCRLYVAPAGWAVETIATDQEMTEQAIALLMDLLAPRNEEPTIASAGIVGE